jgi:hypothetical protein
VEEGSRQFLPPQPAGPEPELGPRPAAQAPPPPPAYAPPAHAAPPQQQQWSYAAPAPQADNGPAVAGFVLSIVSGGLLVITFGISSIVSLACAIFGLVYSRKGKRKVERGETTKHAGLANAGFIVSIVSLVLSAIATAIFVALVIALASDPEFRDDFERELDNSETIRAVARLAIALVT